MARRKNEEPEVEADPEYDRVLVAIGKSKYDSLMRRLIASEKDRAAAAGSAREEIGNAVEHFNLHAKAFAWTKMLKKKAPAQRDELIFHLLTYFKYEGWPGEDLFADRQPAEEPGNVSRLHG